mmetsp:Transcript_21013/g.45465  ORF Transcript_21013/g.45465 Transcript_21013/m.45465 type:complete len:638 (-) Transcript_21013:305-2218(-)|eukprot:CAMPEP_0206505438 /NCGR_PEP_ID=MMETSP0324_2-20121206/56129_1 /ASSEMBLY_ACC=CAM_ASM_000836 /TAXON_ID=2866 /ORGANISM="Crypthecodinium cohnii, Strain Seligo" /LENGTH=637 /DNA_ID=CAMNT_0053994895 /DNA_START=286 /DNA_END=2199 /DNA_ORIENTATION=+
MAQLVTPEQLLGPLRELEQKLQIKLAEEHSFRKANANFQPMNETTTSLLAVCEKLAAMKEKLARANFEEHTSELTFLCKRFNTSIENGHSERSYQEFFISAMPSQPLKERRKSGLGMLCCQRGFPPNQSWWSDAERRLQATYQVLRSGTLVSAQARELVPGDIVFLACGQRCVADTRVLIHADGTSVDCTHLTMDSSDLRRVTTEVTSPAVVDSANIILRDSYLCSGGLFGMVVRSPLNPLMSGSVREPDEDGVFALETSIPAGLSPSMCRTLFKNLTSRPKFVCRSFHTMVKLARTQVLVVLVPKELETSGAAALCATGKRLGKPVVLVVIDDDKSFTGGESWAKENEVEFVDCRASSSSAQHQTGSDPDAISTTAHSTVQSLPVSQTLTGATDCGRTTSGIVSPVFASSNGNAFPRAELVPADVKTRLSEIVSQLSAGGQAGGVLVSTRSPAVVMLMCHSLGEKGCSLLLALGSLQHSSVFRKLVMQQRYGRQEVARRAMTSNSLGVPGEAQSRAQSPTHYPSTSQCTPREPQRWPSFSRQASHVSNKGSFSPTRSMQLHTADPVHLSPAAAAARGENIHKVDLFVSLNSVGVISEYSDAVLLRDDLSCLGQALEMACKAIPAGVLAQTVNEDQV